MWRKKKRKTDDDGNVLSEALLKASMTQDQATMLLLSDDLKLKLPELKEVHQVRMPVYGKDGKVRLLDHGFDAETGTYTLHGIDYDTDMGHCDAFEWFHDLFRHFGWREERRDMAIHLAAAITLFVRGLYKGKAPMFVYNANIQESGKSTLALYNTWLVYGSQKYKPLLEGEDAKLQDTLDTIALAGSMYTVFDNVNWGNHEVQSALLDAWITGKEHDFRKKGGNQLAAPVLRGVTFMTGNSMKLSVDLDRRSLIVDLLNAQAGSERELPKEATLIDDGYFEDVENRRTGLAALWAMVRHWDEEGRPHWTGRLKGSFTQWSLVVPAIVSHAAKAFGKDWNVFAEGSNKEIGNKSGNEYKQLAELCLARFGREEDGIGIKKTFEISVAQMAGVARMNAVATSGLYPEIDIESVLQTEGTKGGWKYVEPESKSQFFEPIDEDENDRKRQAAEWMTPTSRSRFGNAIKKAFNERYFKGPDSELYEFKHRLNVTPARYVVTRVERRR